MPLLDEPKLFLCTTSDIQNNWSIIKPLIEKGVQKAFLAYDSVKDIQEDLLSGRKQGWIAASLKDHNVLGFVITQINDRSRAKVLTIYLCAGHHIHKWVQSIEVIIDWGRQNNCNCVDIVGRRGWNKFLPKYGLKHNYNIYHTKL